MISISRNNNATYIQLGDLEIWYSYETPVAFRFAGKRVVSENVWSSTTGKHLNAIDGGDKESRVPWEVFDDALKSVLDRTFNPEREKE